MHSSQQIHDCIVNRIYHHPEELDIPEALIISKAKEYEMHLYGRLFVCPDIYFNCYDTDIYLEIKSSRSPKCIQKGHDQINRMYEWLAHYGATTFSKTGLIYPKHKKFHRTNFLLEDMVIEWR